METTTALNPWPWVAFIVGAFLSNVYQWAQWVGTRTDKSGWVRWMGYWHIGLPHLVMNVAIDALVCVAWAYNGLDKIIELIPGGPQNVGLPYVPGIGLGLGFFVDLYGDKLAFVVRKVLGSRLPFLNTQEEPKPPTTGGGGQ